ncbi:MAG: ribonuclease T [Halothiobacillaceae bacterium]
MSDTDSETGHTKLPPSAIARRFRGYLPVVVDVETGGFDWQRDALLELAAVVIEIDGTGQVRPGETVSVHVQPFEGGHLNPESLKVNGIDPFNPLRAALPEYEALQTLFQPIRRAVKDAGCRRAILVGHNAAFDLNFLNAAVARTGYKRNPFHPFSTLDTVTLSALAYGQTVLAKAVRASGQAWDSQQAHGAVYDAQRTADLFCKVFNTWGPPHCPVD